MKTQEFLTAALYQRNIERFSVVIDDEVFVLSGQWIVPTRNIGERK